MKLILDKKIFILVITFLVVLLFIPARVARASTETLRPNDAGSETALTTQFPNSTFHWDKVDEEVADDDSTYVRGGIAGAWQRDLYALPAHTGSGTINSVAVYARLKDIAGSNASGKISIRTNSTTYDTSAYNLTTSWADFSNTWTTNPQTTSVWTWDEVDALEAGIFLLGLAYEPSILRGQQVLMADGSQKNIEDVKVGDEIISFNLNSERPELDKVTEVMQGSHNDYLIFNGTLKTSLNHIVWASGDFKPAENIQIGDSLLTSEGQEVVVTQIQYIPQEVETYSLEVEKNHNFFASNYLVHNSLSKYAVCTQVYVVVDYTPDVTSPTVSSVAVQTGSTVNVVFSESMGTGVTTASNYTVSGTGKGALANNPTSAALVSGNTYVLTWSSGEMFNAGDITITVANAQDIAGNAIGSPNSGTHTSGGIGVAPTVSITSPTTGSKVNASKTITFTDNETTSPQCSVDNTNWTACTSNTTTLGDISQFAGITEGATFTLYLKDTDAAGNIGTNNVANLTKDTTAPTFTMQYYSDSDLTATISDNSKLKAGTYYVKITSNETLGSTPTVSIAAEGTANDVTNGATTLVSGNDYKYTRTISADAAAIGTVIEDWSATGTDSATNTATNVSPTNEATKSMYTDTTAPTVSTLSPADNATAVGVNDNLVITFFEAVDAETGNIVIKKTSDNSTFETIAVTSGNVTGSGTTTITANPTGTFTEGADYYVQIDATAFDDASGNSYAGITDTTTWNFTVASCSTVANAATYNAYPTCGVASCNSGYTLSSGACVSSGGGGMPAAWTNPPEAPVDGFSISINNEAKSTTVTDVILNLRGGPNTAKMAISNFPDFRDAGQENYALTKVWSLCWKNAILQTPSNCPAGTYIVYAKFYAPWGKNSETVFDTIIYKTSATTEPFTKDLKFGQISTDIKRLQIFLNQNSDTQIAKFGVGSPGKETNIFGYLTKAAVIRFQEKYASEILTPLGIKKGTGIVSKNTRAKINKLLGF